MFAHWLINKCMAYAHERCEKNKVGTKSDGACYGKGHVQTNCYHIKLRENQNNTYLSVSIDSY